MQYHRPSTLHEAVALLSTGRVLAGGTSLNAESDRPATLIDLQALGLDTIDAKGDRVVIGAMARLSDIAESPVVPELIGDLARRERPSTLRTLATIGGLVAVNHRESALVAALMAFEAQVTTVGTDGERGSALFVGVPSGRIITAVSISALGTAAVRRTARTPADRPIVAAVARRHQDETRLALSGVAEHPVLVDPNDPTAGLTPPADFRGTSAYRLELAAILSARVLGDL